MGAAGRKMKETDRRLSPWLARPQGCARRPRQFESNARRCPMKVKAATGAERAGVAVPINAQGLFNRGAAGSPREVRDPAAIALPNAESANALQSWRGEFIIMRLPDA